MDPHPLIKHPKSNKVAKPGSEKRIPLGDVILLTLLGTLLFSLTLNTVLLGVGIYLIIPGCIIAFLSPYSALLLFSASQVVADPPGLGEFTIARLAFVGFCISCFYKRYKLKGLTVYLRTICILFLWFILVDFIHERAIYPPTILAFTIGAAACIIIAQKGVRWDLALFAICLGSATASMSWWGRYLGFDVTGIIHSRAGLDRLVVGRLVGAAGIPCALASVGFLGLATWRGSVFDTQIKRLCLIGASILAATAVPQTMGRTSLLGLVCGLGLLLWFNVYKIRAKNKRQNLSYFICFSIVVGMILCFNPNTRSYVKKTVEFTQQQLNETKPNLPSLFGPRGWHMYKLVYLSLRYPLIGVPPRETIVTSWDIGTKWELLGRVPHNVFLGVAFNYGLPGMFFYLYFFFIPIIKLYKLPLTTQSGTLMACHSIFFIFFMFMPFGNFKTFFVLWALENAFLIANTSQHQAFARERAMRSPMRIASKPEKMAH